LVHPELVGNFLLRPFLECSYQSDLADVGLGYVTVHAHASGFTAGTDALQGGTGGNVATTTTYYDATALDPASAVGAAMSVLTNSTALTLARA